MKSIILTLSALLSFGIVQAQIHEVGVGFGGANYVGDIGSTQYIAPNNLGFNLTYRLNKSPRHSYRLSYSQMKIKGNDAKSDMGSRKNRGYYFKNNIKELTLGIEFNFLEFDLHHPDFAISPYLFTGISGIQYNDLYFRNNKLIENKDKKNYSVAIPIVAGVKTRINERFILSTEVGAHYTFTNNLDGSSPTTNNSERFKFGKENSNDWYFYTGLTLTYTFGKNPCYCTPDK